MLISSIANQRVHSRRTDFKQPNAFPLRRTVVGDPFGTEVSIEIENGKSAGKKRIMQVINSDEVIRSRIRTLARETPKLIAISSRKPIFEQRKPSEKQRADTRHR
jgi:hypothetical protein